MYRHMDALVVRAAACRLTGQPGWWPEVTERAAGSASWRPWLRQVLAMPEFAALDHASPVLADRARAICDGSPVPNRTARRVVLAVMRYLLRARGRATPYGLFAGVAPAHVAAAGPAHLGGAHRAVTRVRAEWLATLLDRLESDPGLRPHLTVRSNNLLVERGRYVVLEHRASRTRGGAPTHLWVRAAGPVRAALAIACDPIRLGDLAQRLRTDFNTGADRADTLLAQMVAQRLLVTNLRPAMTATDPLAHVVTKLEAVVGDDDADVTGLVNAGHIIPRLRQIIDRAARQDSSSTVATACKQRTELAATLAALCPTDEAAVAVDLCLGYTVAVPPAVAAEAARAAGLLVRLARPDTSGWAGWHGRFLERFGPHAVVPVLQAVDPDIGLGYPAGYQSALPIPPPALTDRDRKLLALAQRAALARQQELVLDEDTLAALTGNHPTLPIQPTTELTVRVHAPSMNAVECGEFQLSIVGVSRHAGTTTGRFLDLFAPADRERIAAQYGALPTATRGALRVQISAATPYTITEDVARAPQVMPYILPIGEYHDNLGDSQILLHDLAVTADEHRIYLVSVSRRQVIEPLVFNAVESTRHTLPLVRFLAEAPTALSTPCTAFDWGAAAHLPFLPALRHGRTILSPARWLLSDTELPDPTTSWQRWSRSLAAWRDGLACPAMVYLGDGDQRINLDLADPAHQALLRDHLTRRDHALLRAAPPRNLHVVDVREHGHLPGYGGRCYVKLYGHPDRQTTILTHHLPFLLHQLDTGVRWWFLRYGDPAPHLRLRLSGSVDAAAVGTWTRRLRHAGLTARVQLETDYPETARFGGPAALAAAEEHFAADSAAALAQLAAADNVRGLDVLAVTAASLLDLAAAFIGDPAEAMRWLIDHTRAHRAAPARAVYDQAVLLANPHNRAELAALKGGDQILACWVQRRRALDAYRDTLHTTGTAAATELLPDLLHLHHVRMAGPDPDSERTCLHLARAAALSWTTRAGSRT